MTLQEFGQSIKKKYPQYNSVDDIELAKRTIEKYPVYKGQISDLSSLEKPGYVSQVATNLKNNFTSGAQEISKDVSEVGSVADKAGGDALAKTLAVGSAAGNVAGTVAGTAGGILGSFITPLLPDSTKQKIGDVVNFIDDKIKSIPGMTPDIHQALGDVFNTVSLLGGSKAVPAAEKVGAQAVSKVAETTTKGVEKTAQVVKQVGEKIPQYSEKAAKLLATEPSEQIKTILKETPTSKFDKYLKVAQESSIDPRKTSLFEQVGDELVNATKQLKKQADSIGAQKSTIIQKAKTGLQEFTEAPRKAIIQVSKLAESPIKDKIITRLKSVKTKLDADKAIDDIQAMIYEASGTNLIAKGSTIEKQLRGIIGEMNNALKDSLPTAYRNLNVNFSNRIKVINTLNKALGEVVDGVPTRGASLIKQFFSPAGSKTKELFEFIKKNTGVDLAQDATLAKFMGELFDDPKVKSLLEGIPTGKHGIISKVVDIASEKSGLEKKVQNIMRKNTIQQAKKLTK